MRLVSRGILGSAAPVAVAIGIFAVSFGVAATATGARGWLVVLASMLIFAGAAQFAMVSVLAAGGLPAAAVASALLLNLRYLGIGTAAAPAIRGGRPRRFLLSQLLVDEGFALGVAAGSQDRPDGRVMLVSGALFWVVWVAGTAVGALLGPVLGDPRRFGIDAAFPAAFVALLWPLLRDRRATRAALGGAVTALVLAPFTPSGVPLAAAAVAGLALYR